MADPSASVEIARPPEEVFDYLVGLNDREWRSGVVEMRLLSDRQHGVGARHIEVRQLLGRRIELAAEVVAYEPPRRWAVRRATGRVRPQVTYELEPLPTGTRVTSSLSLPGGRRGAKATGPLVRLFGRVAGRDLGRLKEKLQRGGPSPAPEAQSGPAFAGSGRAGPTASESRDRTGDTVSATAGSGNDDGVADRDHPEKHQPDRHGEEKPDTPTDLPKRSWFATLKRTVKEFQDDNITDWAAALTYYSVLSLFPALLVLVAIVGLAGGQQTVNTLMNIVTQVAPQGAADTFRPTIEGVVKNKGGAGALFGVGLLGAVWSASGYIGAFFRAANSIWEIEEGRGPVKLIPLRLLVTVLMLVLVAAVLLAVVISGPIAEAVGNVVGLGPQTVTVWSIAKWPAILLVVSGIVAFLFYVAPNARLPGFRWVTPGGVLAVVLAIVASLLFGVYVANFGSYNATYGALGGVIVFLLWLWIINNALLFGSELDAELERSRELHEGKDAEEELQLPPRSEPKSA
jgi:membrane protein